jgi:hypothetical protein
LPSLSGRLSEPEATSHFKKVHRLFEDGEIARFFKGLIIRRERTINIA